MNAMNMISGYKQVIGNFYSVKKVATEFWVCTPCNNKGTWETRGLETGGLEACGSGIVSRNYVVACVHRHTRQIDRYIRTHKLYFGTAWSYNATAAVSNTWYTKEAYAYEQKGNVLFPNLKKPDANLTQKHSQLLPYGSIQQVVSLSSDFPIRFSNFLTARFPKITSMKIIYLHVCLSIYPSIYLSIYLSIYHCITRHPEFQHLKRQVSTYHR